MNIMYGYRTMNSLEENFQGPDVLYLARIQQGSIKDEWICKEVQYDSKIDFRYGIVWGEVLFSTVGITYLLRTIQYLLFDSLSPTRWPPHLITIWAGPEYAGHILTFCPRRNRLPFLGKAPTREITYGVAEKFRQKGFGSCLLARAIQDATSLGADVVGLIRQDNWRSLRVFEKFSCTLTPVARERKLFQARYRLLTILEIERLQTSRV